MQSAQFQLHAAIEERHWWFVGRRAIMGRLARRVVPPSPESTVVDVGCGTGANLASLADDYDCVGIDTSQEAVEAARRRFPKVKFLVGRAPEDLGPTAEQARLFLLMDVLEHVEDDLGMFSELVESASPGSFFLVTVPADPRLWSQHDESFGHFRRYERPRLEQVWQGLPIEPLLVSHYSARVYPAVRAIRGVGRLRGKACGRVGTDFWMPPALVNRILTAAFAGEGRTLEAALDGRRHGYAAGSSLIAVLRRTQ